MSRCRRQRPCFSFERLDTIRIVSAPNPSLFNVRTQRLHSRYVLIAFSEIFASITGLEYAFTKAPKNMRSLVMAVFLFTSAIASALGEAFVCEFGSSSWRRYKEAHDRYLALSSDPLLVWNYGVMGVLAIVAGIFFWITVRKLDKEEDKLNNLSGGHLGEEAKA